MKAVFDTNVLIAAFLTEGLCSGLLIRARKQAFNLVLCDDIIREFEGILTATTPVWMKDDHTAVIPTPPVDTYLRYEKDTG